MMKFRHEDNRVICQSDDDRPMVVATAVDDLWARAIADALNMAVPL